MMIDSINRQKINISQSHWIEVMRKNRPQPPAYAPFVAEVSSNHNQDLDRCLRFIDEAARVGCDAVKFQLFKIDDLFSKEILTRSPEHTRRRDWELPASFLPHLAERCRINNIGFSCTPFYLEAVDQLEPFVDCFKISSYELLWTDLLKRCAQTGKPIVLSTGMATLNEILDAVTLLEQFKAEQMAILHCVSQYPVIPGDCHLAFIESLREKTGYPVGWSDHSVNPGVVYRAIHRWGAAMIEFHLDLDGRGSEYASGHCWLPEQIQPVIETVQHGYLADGKAEKILHPEERRERDWRADPSDGLRPFQHIRERWRDRSCT